MKNKKKVWITVTAVVAAVIGAVVAVAAFMKKKADAISEKLDYNEADLYDDELIEDMEGPEAEVDELTEEAPEELPEEGTEAV